MDSGGSFLASLTVEEQHAIRQVTTKKLKQCGLTLQMGKSAFSPIKKKGSKNKSRTVASQGMPVPGCCFNQKLGAIPHRDMVELVPDCFACIPRVLVHMVNFLDERRDVEGIFRISGTNRRLRLLRQSVCQQPIVEDLSWPVSPHDVASLLKHFFRDIPGLFFSKECLHDLMAAAERYDTDDAMLERIILDLCLLLPELKLATLRYIATFFNRVASDSHRNKMPIDNLACVLTPNLMGPAGPGLVLSRQTKIVGHLLASATSIGMLSPDQMAAARKMACQAAKGSQSAGTHYLRSLSKRHTSTDSGLPPDRKPLGTINNFVSSIASRISGSRRSSVSTFQRHAASASTSMSAPLRPSTGYRGSHSASCDGSADLTDLPDPSIKAPSCGKRRAHLPCHELSPPAKKHSDTHILHKLERGLAVPSKAPALRARSLPFTVKSTAAASTEPSMPRLGSSPPDTVNTTASRTSSVSDPGSSSSDPERHIIAIESKTSKMSLRRMSATRITSHRGHAQLRKVRKRYDVRDLAEHESLDGSGDSPPTTCPPTPMCNLHSSSLASAAMDTSSRIIGRSIKLADMFASNGASALDVSDISIHLPSVGSGNDTEELGGAGTPETSPSLEFACGLV